MRGFERLPIDRHLNIPQHVQRQTCGRHNDVGFQKLTAAQLKTIFRDRLNGVCDHAGVTASDLLEQVAVWNEAQPLIPWLVVWREMLCLFVRAQLLGSDFDQITFDKFGLAAGQLIRKHAQDHIFDTSDLISQLDGQELLQSE